MRVLMGMSDVEIELLAMWKRHEGRLVVAFDRALRTAAGFPSAAECAFLRACEQLVDHMSVKSGISCELKPSGIVSEGGLVSQWTNESTATMRRHRFSEEDYQRYPMAVMLPKVKP